MSSVERISAEVDRLRELIAKGDVEIKTLADQLELLRKKRGARIGRLADLKKALRLP